MKMDIKTAKPAKKPKWIKVKLPIGKKYTELRNLVENNNLNTICTSGSCPRRADNCGDFMRRSHPDYPGQRSPLEYCVSEFR